MFLERQSQLDLLDQKLADVRSGQGRMVFVGGEAGAGKTSLIQHFLQEHSDSCRVLIGTCDPISAPSALGPFYDVARMAGGDFARLLDVGASRPQLTGALMALLTDKNQQTILVIEDAHWADEATFDLIRFMGRRIDSTNTLAVVSYRDDHVIAGNFLRDTMGDLATAHSVTRISLPPLSLKSIAQLTAERPIDSAEVCRLTGGNPFFVHEVLEADGAFPLTVGDAILARTSRLPESTSKLLELVAVFGPEVDLDLLAMAAAAEVTDDVDASVESRLLRVTQNSVAFRHELVRQAILESIPPARATLLHRKALNASLLAGTRRDPVRIAYHAAKAGDRTACIDFGPIAAARLSLLGRHQDAIVQYEQTLDLIDTNDATLLRALLFGYANELAACGHYVRAVPVINRLVAIARDSHDVDGEADALQLLSLTHHFVGDYGPSLEALDRALGLFDHGLSDVVRTRVLATRIHILMFNGKPAEALRLGAAIPELCEHNGDKATLSRALISLGSAHMLLGEMAIGEHMLQFAYQLSQELGLHTQAAHAITNLGSLYCEMFQFVEAEPHLIEGVSYATDRELASWRSHCFMQQSQMHLYRGDLSQAKAVARQVIDDPLGCGSNITYALIALGRAMARLGDAEADAPLMQALQRSIDGSLPIQIADSHLALAESAWLQGDVESASLHARQGVDIIEVASHAWTTPALQFWTWLLEGRQSQSDYPDNPYAMRMRGDWQGAASSWQTRECPYDQAFAMTDSNDEPTLLKALAIFERLEATPMIRRTCEQLRQLGASVIPRGPRKSTRMHPNGLTARETEVLAELAQGKTNTEIAEALFLSPKTVEHHVSAILAKTGARTRKQAVDRAAMQPSILALTNARINQQR